MRGELTRLVAVLAWVAACSKPDPLRVCRDLGPTGFAATTPTCSSASCRACASALEGVWRDRADPAKAAVFRTRFMGIAAEARDAFASRARPDGSYSYEHCTALTAPSAACAEYSRYCVDVIASGLRSGSTVPAQRTQYNLAASRACSEARGEIVRELTSRCDVPPGGTSCEGAACASCVAGYIAAMSVLAPLAEREPEGAAMQRSIDGTPEPVARVIAETLGAQDAPADVETVVVQRAERGYCFSLLARSAEVAPYACNAVVVRFLTHAEYGDSAKAWAALGAAHANVRSAALDVLFVAIAGGESVSAGVLEGLRGLSGAETNAAVLRAMRLPTASAGVYAGLREFLMRAGVTGAELPPVVRAAPGVAPAGESAPRGADAPGAGRGTGGAPLVQG